MCSPEVERTYNEQDDDYDDTDDGTSGRFSSTFKISRRQKPIFVWVGHVRTVWRHVSIIGTSGQSLAIEKGDNWAMGPALLVNELGLELLLVKLD